MNDILTNLIGAEGIRLNISIDMVSVTYLALAAILAGVIIALISKKLIK